MSISEQALSQQCKESLREWFIECNTKHSCFKHKKAPPPKRLVRIFAGDQEFCGKVIETNHETNYRYAALSYCWGKASPFHSTTETLPERKKGIQRSELPSTLLDAIKVARWLGLNYIWIDSLCILQDHDQKDWQEQAARMADIYEYAYVTIGATSASDCRQGFLCERETSKALYSAHDCGVPFTVLVRPRLGHRALFNGNWETHPLFKRAWCFQERLISRRVLHFTRNELVFECGEGLRCECSRILQHGYGNRLKALYRMTLRHSSIASSKDAEIKMAANHTSNLQLTTFKLALQPHGENSSTRFWDLLVTDYASKELTYDTDILVALSATARRLSVSFGTYLAGLWEYTLPVGLLWASAPAAPLIRCHRPKEYTAPTFSWASRLGPLSFKLLMEHYTTDCAVLDAKCTPKCVDNFGAVAAGFVKLAGRVTEATFGGLTYQSQGRVAGVVRKDSETEMFDPDTVEDEDIQTGTCLYCFQICSFPDVKYYYDENGTRHPPWDPNSEEVKKAIWYANALVLRIVAPPTTFERIGIVVRMKNTWFDKVDKSEITII
jgi:Heterokaryon incompatibility protein (HET)